MNWSTTFEVWLGVLGALLSYDCIIWLINFLRKNVEIKRVDPPTKDAKDDTSKAELGPILY